MRKKRYLLRFLIPVAFVVVALWWARWWPFGRSAALPPANIPAVAGDGGEKAYGALGGSFRDKVLLTEFSTMFNRMRDPDFGAELPQIRQATVSDGAGADSRTARFRVEYPSAKARAEYLFARDKDGGWHLRSFSRIQGEWRGGEGEAKAQSPGTAVGPGKSPRLKEAEKKPDGSAGESAKAGTATQPSATTQRKYVVQPGDTLSSISKHFYGTTRHVNRILEANHGLTTRVRAGRTIAIPSSPDLPPLKDEAGSAPKPASATP